MRVTLKYVSVLLALLLVISVGGVFAVWQYAQGMPEPRSGSVSADVSEFIWKPEEILPTEQPGENYMDLLDSVLNNNKGGLNSSKGTLENAVLKYEIVHSSQNVQGGNLKHLFITSESKKLDFIVQYVSDTEFHIYMFEEEHTLMGQVNVTNIPVYKTILVEEGGEWIGQESKLGYAKIRYIGSNNYRAIDPDEWVYGYLPT